MGVLFPRSSADIFVGAQRGAIADFVMAFALDEW